MYIKKIKPNTKFIAQNIEYFKTLDSTNTVAKEIDYKDGTLVISENQTMGKGRMGREWISEQNSGIYMSLVLFPKMPIEKINFLTLLAGLSVCEVLNELCKISFKIKWPNDIVTDGKKVCGILTEGVVSKTGTKAVIGIGINVSNKNFSHELIHKATSLYILTGKNYSKETIISKIAENFEKKYQEFLNGKNFKEEYEGLCVNINRHVTAMKDGNQIHGTAVGVTETGELMIKKEDGTALSINSGEVSVRGIYGYY